METKFCKYCQTDHPLTEEFWLFRKRNTNGTLRIEHICRIRNKDKCKQRHGANKESDAILAKEWRCSHKDELSQYREAHSEHIKANKKRYRKDNLETVLQKERQRHEKNKDREREVAKAYYYANKERTNKSKTDKHRTDTRFRFMCRLRTRVRTFFLLGGIQKRMATRDMLGCSWSELDSHLKATFLKTYGEAYDETKHDVHIDHIIPLSSGKTEEELIKLCHYTNLQLLTAFDNLSKSDKY